MAGVRITDEPRFGWRGVHLDVGRHFMPLADLFRFVDLIALHKYNVFHLHLTEDQGWRFASDSVPEAAGAGQLAVGDPAALPGLRRRHPARRLLHPRPAAGAGPLRRRSRGHGDARAGVPRSRAGPAGGLSRARQPSRDRLRAGHHVRRLPRGAEPVRRGDDGRLRPVHRAARGLRQPVRARGRRRVPPRGVAGQPRRPRAGREARAARVRSTCSAGSPSSCGTGWPPATAGWSAGTRSTTRGRSRVPSPWRGGTRRTGSRRPRPGWT